MQKLEIECKKLKFKLIDRQVAKVQQNKMAGNSGESDDVLIQSLRENAMNKNTVQSTNNWVKVWKSWAAQKGHDESIEKYEPEALNKILEQFYATVRKKDGDDYEPDSLRVMVTAIDRYLTEKEYKYSIIRDREFKSSKQVLEGKARLLRQQGKGKRPNKARSLTTTEENELWEKKKLGKGSPQAVVQTIWWLLTQYFGLRGRQEHHSMTVEDFSFGLDENNTEYVEFIENPTKTRQSGLSAKPRSFLPKMFATGGDRCPVTIFKEFLSRRPPEICPLYLSCVSNPSSQVWYKRQPMGVNKLNDMMKAVIKGTTLEDSRKTFSNHSARKTVVKKLKIAGLERSSIVKVTGHRNEKSLDDYDEGDENEQRQLSHTISHGTNINSQVARGNSSTSVHSSTNSSSNTFSPSSLDGRGNNFNQAGFAVQMPSYISGQNDQRQSFMNMNHFHQCQVTFNIGSTAAPEKPQSAAPNGEDNISASN